MQYPVRYQLALTCSVNFSKIYFALSNFLAFVPPELFCQKPPALFPLTSPWLNIVCPVDIKVLQPRPAHVPRHLHVQWYDDAMEDVNEEEVGQLVDPEDLGWGEEGNVVLTELQKAEAMPDKSVQIFKESMIPADVTLGRKMKETQQLIVLIFSP